MHDCLFSAPHMCASKCCADVFFVFLGGKFDCVPWSQQFRVVVPSPPPLLLLFLTFQLLKSSGFFGGGRRGLSPRPVVGEIALCNILWVLGRRVWCGTILCITHPCADFPSSISTPPLELWRYRKCRRWKYVAERDAFRSRIYRSVSAPLWLSSNRGWKLPCRA